MTALDTDSTSPSTSPPPTTTPKHWSGVWFVISGFLVAQVVGLMTSLPGILADNPVLQRVLLDGAPLSEVLESDFTVGPATTLLSLAGQWSVLLLWARMWARKNKRPRQVVQTAVWGSPEQPLAPAPRSEWLSRLGLIRPTKKHLLQGLVLGVAATVLANGAEIAGKAAGLKTSGVETAGLLLTGDGALGVVLLLCVAIGAPLVEEIFFRGALAGAFARRFGTAVAIGASAALFGIVHLSGFGSGNIANVVIITGLGVAFAIARFRTGTLVVGIVAHAVVNSTAVVAVTLVGAS